MWEFIKKIPLFFLIYHNILLNVVKTVSESPILLYYEYLERDMSNGRMGIWKCPSCGHHQIWKTRNSKSNRLDRSCQTCGIRIRSTISRSASGKGRSRTVEIWERKTSTSIVELEREAERRNERDFEDYQNEIIGSNDDIRTAKQSELPIIWGLGWNSSLKYIQFV